MCLSESPVSVQCNCELCCGPGEPGALYRKPPPPLSQFNPIQFNSIQYVLYWHVLPKHSVCIESTTHMYLKINKYMHVYIIKWINYMNSRILWTIQNSLCVCVCVCVCVCGHITDLLTPPSFCDRHQCILLLVRYSLFFPNKYLSI